MVWGNEMDVQLVHSQVAKQRCCLVWWIVHFEKEKGWKKGSDIVEKTRFVFDCVGARRRQNVYFTCSGIFPPLFWNWINAGIQTSPWGIKSSDSMAAEITYDFGSTIYGLKHGWRLKLKWIETTPFLLFNLVFIFSTFSVSLLLLDSFLKVRLITFGTLKAVPFFTSVIQAYQDSCGWLAFRAQCIRNFKIS